MRKNTITFLLLSLSSITIAQTFNLANNGCPMVHCDQQMSDNSTNIPPAANIGLVWQQYTNANLCTWCATNDSIVACSFMNTNNPTIDNLVVFDFNGNIKFTDNNILNNTAGLSGHLIGEDGSVIVADTSNVVRFNADGTIQWQTSTNGAGGSQPMSLNLTANGQIIIASRGGPVAAYDKESGVQTSVIYPTGNLTTGYYETLNTPAVRGNRVYLLCQKEGLNPTNKGALISIDVTPTSMTEVWEFPFRSESGASPTVINDTIFFDGDGLNPGGPQIPKVFAVKDNGTAPSLIWTYDIPTGQRLISSVNLDPRGGIWFYPRPNYGKLVRLNQTNGFFIEEINYNSLINAANNVGINTSTTIFFDGGVPYMSFGVTPAPPLSLGEAYFVVLNLSTNTIHWKYKLSSNAINFANAGSAPLLTIRKNGNTRLVAGTTNFGVMCFGDTLLTTGFTEHHLAIETKLYPNPGNGIVKVQFAHQINGIFWVNDLLGKIVATGNIKNQNEINIDLSSLEKCIYLFNVTTESGAKTIHKMIIH